MRLELSDLALSSVHPVITSHRDRPSSAGIDLSWQMLEVYSAAKHHSMPGHLYLFMIRPQCVLNFPISLSALFIQGLWGSVVVQGTKWVFWTLLNSVKSHVSTAAFSEWKPSSGIPYCRMASMNLSPQSASERIGYTLAQHWSWQKSCAHVRLLTDFTLSLGNMVSLYVQNRRETSSICW